MIYEAQSGHPGRSLSGADIILALYFKEMNINTTNPKWEDRDRFVLSKGHVCPILYAALGKLGYFPKEYLHKLRQEGSILRSSRYEKISWSDLPTGSLGQGLSCAVGMAIAGKRDNKNYRVFAMLGDGECGEGKFGKL